jgi:hypothetical protein
MIRFYSLDRFLNLVGLNPSSRLYLYVMIRISSVLASDYNSVVSKWYWYSSRVDDIDRDSIVLPKTSSHRQLITIRCSHNSLFPTQRLQGSNIRNSRGYQLSEKNPRITGPRSIELEARSIIIKVCTR